MADQNSTSPSDFETGKLKNVNRLTSLPFVRQTLDFSFSFYARVKTFNPLLDGTLTKVEQISTAVVSNFQPVVGRFDKQIVQVDGMLGQALDSLETYVPAVKTASPVAVFEYTVNKTNEVRTIAVQQVENVKTFGFSKIDTIRQSPLVQAGFHALDAILQSFDKAVETYLPAGTGESETDSDAENDPANRNILKKISNLTNKLRLRLTKFTTEKILYAQRLLL